MLKQRGAISRIEFLWAASIGTNSASFASRGAGAPSIGGHGCPLQRLHFRVKRPGQLHLGKVPGAIEHRLLVASRQPRVSTLVEGDRPALAQSVNARKPDLPYLHSHPQQAILSVSTSRRTGTMDAHTAPHHRCLRAAHEAARPCSGAQPSVPGFARGGVPRVRLSEIPHHFRGHGFPVTARPCARLGPIRRIPMTVLVPT